MDIHGSLSTLLSKFSEHRDTQLSSRNGSYENQCWSAYSCVYIHPLENSLAIHSQHCKKGPILCLRWHPSSRNLLKDPHLFPSQRTKSDKLLPNLGSFE